MSRPDSVTKLTAATDLRSITIDWRPLDWSTTVDHYRVYAAHGSSVEPTEDNLLAKSVYPRFAHRGLDVAGETWTYRIVTVDAAGRRSRPSKSITAQSTRSVTVGDPVATVGDFDAKTLEFRFAPDQFEKMPAAYPDATISVQHGDDAAAQWPYLLPGPGDTWAGNKAYSLTWTIPLTSVPAKTAMAIWLVDTTRLAGTLQVEVNDGFSTSRTLIAGGTRGSRDGDANLPATALVPSYHEFDLPADALITGDNRITLTLAEGGWLAWDAIGIFQA